MTRKDIIQMAHKSSLDVYGLGKDYEKFADALERFAILVAAAKCEQLADQIDGMPFGDTAASFAVWIREQA